MCPAVATIDDPDAEYEYADAAACVYDEDDAPYALDVDDVPAAPVIISSSSSSPSTISLEHIGAAIFGHHPLASFASLLHLLHVPASAASALAPSLPSSTSLATTTIINSSGSVINHQSSTINLQSSNIKD